MANLSIKVMATNLEIGMEPGEKPRLPAKENRGPPQEEPREGR